MDRAFSDPMGQGDPIEAVATVGHPRVRYSTISAVSTQGRTIDTEPAMTSVKTIIGNSIVSSSVGVWFLAVVGFPITSDTNAWGVSRLLSGL